MREDWFDYMTSNLCQGGKSTEGSPNLRKRMMGLDALWPCERPTVAHSAPPLSPRSWSSVHSAQLPDSLLGPGLSSFLQSPRALVHIYKFWAGLGRSYIPATREVENGGDPSAPLAIVSSEAPASKHSPRTGRQAGSRARRSSGWGAGGGRMDGPPGLRPGRWHVLLMLLLLPMAQQGKWGGEEEEIP